MSRLSAIVLAALLSLACGCVAPTGVQVAIDAAHAAVDADDAIIGLYHGAVMETFDQVRAAHLAEAKRIAAGLADKGELTPELVSEGFDRLAAALEEIERRRARFQDLARLAAENNANAREALQKASDLVARASDTQEKVRRLVSELDTSRTQETAE